ncbi:MAG: nitrite reductase small subunit NirD [Gammaproteobacteria bacterium]|nr:nitrite reductase small subunit NirD [Gammaproteobacteria bacterium]
MKANKWHPVCSKDDLVPDSGVCALVNDQQVAIFYLPDEKQPLYAIGNWDPIGRANVLSRGIVADVGGELTVASPLYKQHFNLLTGQCLEDETVSVPVYEVALDGDTVMIGE